MVHRTFSSGIHLQANFKRAHLEGAYLEDAHLEEANLYEAHLEKGTLYGAHLEGAILTKANLAAADLMTAQLQGTNLSEARLEGANLTHITLDNKTSLHEVVLGDHKHGTAQLVDISWGNANLTAIDWTDVKALGDEQKASRPTTKDGRRKDKTQRLKEFQQALRANRQLAVVLGDQGLYEEADRFAYRAQRLKRIILRRRVFFPKTSLWRRIRSLSGYIFSLLLDALGRVRLSP